MGGRGGTPLPSSKALTYSVCRPPTRLQAISPSFSTSGLGRAGECLKGATFSRGRLPGPTLPWRALPSRPDLTPKAFMTEHTTQDQVCEFALHNTCDLCCA